MVNCHASIKGLFTGMIVFASTVISIILYAVFRNKIGEDRHASPMLATTATTTIASVIMNYPPFTRTLRLRNRTGRSIPHQLIVGPSLVQLSSGHGPFATIADSPKRLLYSIAIVEIVNLCLLILSLMATTWALMKIRKLQYRRTTTRKETKRPKSNVFVSFLLFFFRF
jgi:hypothetical protein